MGDEVKMMAPIRLFSVSESEKEVDVFYQPQYGVVMEGLTSEGSSKTVAKHISKRFKSSRPGVIDPHDLSEETIIHDIHEWLLSDGEEKDVVEDDNEDE